MLGKRLTVMTTEVIQASCGRVPLKNGKANKTTGSCFHVKTLQNVCTVKKRTRLRSLDTRLVK